ncbi:MAG: DUF2252 domain-containing protein [Candidatus Kapabacteria bacterium]|nr:DUF2252 domain-containing protein [Candidatus Kapabacteria bacterium]
MKRPSRTQRIANGKELRIACPRTSQAAWKLRPTSISIIDLLEESNANRVAGLIPVRYGRMAQSPLHFFRGTAIIQARDLFTTSASGIIVQACGDAHLSNFGGFATPERSLAFDINDFDETFPAPWEWDLKRLTASIVIAARYLGFTAADAEDAVRTCVGEYRKRMAEYSELTVLETWYARITMDDLKDLFKKDKDLSARLGKKTTEARGRTSESVFPKLTTVIDGERLIVDDPPLIYHIQNDTKTKKKNRKAILSQYRDSLQEDRRKVFDAYELVDAAFKVVGVGSVGTRCFVALFLADDNDPLFLQLKEARRSVLENPKGKSRYKHQGERIVSGQRHMQASSDIFLGWARSPEGIDYFIRQLRDQKVSADIESFKRRTLSAYALLCGWGLARAHAKAGDAPMISGYVGTSDQLDTALTKYSFAYADQVERDFDTFQKAIRTGRLKTDTESPGI